MSRNTYLVHLIVDDAVIDAGSTDNCRHALRGAYEALYGIPSAEATVRADGRLWFFLATDWRGSMKEVEFYPKPTRSPGARYGHSETVIINPLWNGWPQFVNSPRGTDLNVILNERSES